MAHPPQIVGRSAPHEDVRERAPPATSARRSTSCI
jgi:hypothetical protein